MNHTGFRFSASLVALATATALLVSACSSGDVAVGSTQQALQKKKDGTPTGNGQTCSWDDTVSYDVATGKETYTPAPDGPYTVGDTFPSSDGCNTCTCTAQGIACTLRACGPAGGGGTCSYDGKTYASGETFRSTDGCNGCGCNPDGTVACTLMACAPAQPCQDDARVCPDGSAVGRTGPNCTFPACPGEQACDLVAKVCPDGSTVGRTGPNCEFAPCP